MSTIIRATQFGYNVSGLPQNYTITEGALSQAISPIGITPNGSSYADYFYAQFDIIGTYQVAAITLESSTLTKLVMPRTNYTDPNGVPAAYYALDSRYTELGVSINNWAYFQKALLGLSLKFSNSDISQNFVVRVRIWSGVNSNPIANTLITDQNITINVVAIPDMTGVPQTITGLPMAFNERNLVTMGGSYIQIADPQEAAKTYRITLTVNNVENASGWSSGILSLWDTANGVNQQFANTVTLSGTQTYINSVLSGNVQSTKGLYFGMYAPDFFGTYTVSYVQEVLTTTEPGATVPYVQETGLLTLTIDYSPAFVLQPAPTYLEDVTTPPFRIAALTDQAGQQWSHEVCGATSFNGFNCYTFDIQALGTFSPTNPIFVTTPGDAGGVNDNFSVTGDFAYQNNPANPLSNIQVIPPADYTDPITLRVRLYRGNGQGGNIRKLVQESNMVINCASTHAEFILNAAHPFVIGSNTLNFGQITDTAVSKNYSSTLQFVTAMPATLASGGSGGTSVWNPTGGTGGFGILTLTGNKTQVNSHLSTINLTTTGGATIANFTNIRYSQTQTTNSINQGSQDVFIGNTIQWQSGNGIHNGQNAFVYDQDVSMTWNLAQFGGQIDDVTSYTAKLIFSTPLTTANLGSVTGWTRETDLIWTRTGVKSVLNAALAALVFNPPAQLLSDFQLDIAIYNGAALIANTVNFGSTKTVYLRTPVTVTWNPANLTYNQDMASTLANLGSLNANFNEISIYTLRLITSVDTGGTITGWTKINATTFEKIDTKSNLQNSLNSVVFTPSLLFISNFNFNIQAFRSSLIIYDSSLIPNSKIINFGIPYSIAFTGTTLSFNQDTTTTWANFATLSVNFSASKTYTVDLVTSIDNVGSFTGWTQTSPTTHTKTDNGLNLQNALNSIEFIPFSALITNFSINIKAATNSTIIYDSSLIPTSKTINIGSTLNVEWGTAVFSFSENTKKTFATFAVLNSTFDPAKTYKLEIVSSTPLSVTNGGSITGWTRQSDTLWSKTDTGANLQIALNSVELVPSADYRSAITFTIRTYRNSILVHTSLNKIVTVAGTNINKNTIISSLQLTKYQNTLTASIGSITDNRPDNIDSSIKYLVTITPLFFGNLILSSGGTGGTSSWNGKNLTLTGTKTEVNSRLASITFGYSDLQTTSVEVVQTQTTNSVGQGTKTFSLIRPAADSFVTSTGAAFAVYSTDNLDWISKDVTTGTCGIKLSFKGTKWVAPDLSGQSDKFLRANVFNGTTWTSNIVDSTASYAGIGNQNIARARTFYNDQFLAVFVGNKIKVFKSSDTVIWTLVYEYADESPGYGDYSYMNFSSSGGRLFISTSLRGPIISGSNLMKVTIHSSGDGTTWTRSNQIPSTSEDAVELPNNYEPIYNYNNQTWIMAGYYQRDDIQVVPQAKIFQSSDGTSWTNTSTFNNAFPIGKFETNGNNTFVLPMDVPEVGGHYNLISTSGGASWSSTAAWPSQVNPTQNFASNSIIVYAQGLYVARQGNNLLSSTNGTTWTVNFTISSSLAFYDLVVINNAFYAKSGDTIYRSLNGTTWTVIESVIGYAFSLS